VWITLNVADIDENRDKYIQNAKDAGIDEEGGTMLIEEGGRITILDYDADDKTLLIELEVGLHRVCVEVPLTRDILLDIAKHTIDDIKELLDSLEDVIMKWYP